jgi:hypothetical protein
MTDRIAFKSAGLVPPQFRNRQPEWVRGEKVACGCCRGPESDRCCCWIHQDRPHGLLPHKCSLHCEEA